MKKLMSMILAVVCLFIFACSSAPKEAEKPEGFEKVYRPDWFDEQNSDKFLYFFGNAEKHNENLAYDAAVANARLESANYVEVYVKGMVKNYLEEVGTDDPTITALTSKTVRTVANTKFSGTFVSKREIIVNEGVYKAFIRLSVPKDVIEKTLAGEIKKEEALYNAFKASQSFQELDKQTEKSE